jgi:hypothetical protein
MKFLMPLHGLQNLLTVKGGEMNILLAILAVLAIAAGAYTFAALWRLFWDT